MSTTPSDRFEYLPGRWILRGEKIRLSRGPYYLADDGRRLSMAERGVFVLLELFVDKFRRRHLVLSGSSGASVVVPIKPRRSKFSLAGYRPRPYRFAKVGATRREIARRRTQ